MKLINKILIITAGIIMTVSLVYGNKNDTENLFDEKKWRESINDVDSLLFYAPHFKDGEYFNPWLKMDRKGFFSVFKWHFFSDKPVYSIDEESFCPEVKSLTAELLIHTIIL